MGTMGVPGNGNARTWLRQNNSKAESEGGSPSGAWLLGWAFFISRFNVGIAAGEVTATLMSPFTQIQIL